MVSTPTLLLFLEVWRLPNLKDFLFSQSTLLICFNSPLPKEVKEEKEPSLELESPRRPRNQDQLELDFK